MGVARISGEAKAKLELGAAKFCLIFAVGGKATGVAFVAGLGVSTVVAGLEVEVGSPEFVEFAKCLVSQSVYAFN